MTGRALGVHESVAPAATVPRFPGHRWGREFVAGPDGAPLPESTTDGELAAKVVARAGLHTRTGGGCVLSIKAPMKAVAKGKWDDRLARAAAELQGQDVIVLLWHEPEDDLKPDVFVPAHNHAREVMRRAAPGLQVGYAGMAYQWRPGSPTTRAPLAWTGALEADIYLCDVYSGKTFPADTILPEHPGWVRWYDEMIAAHPGRRWGIAERGILAGPARAATIAREADWLATDPVGRTCELFLWWNTGGTEANPGWVLDADGERAVAELLARLNQPVTPPGFRPSPLDGFLVSEQTGCLVAGDLLAVHAAAHL